MLSKKEWKSHQLNCQNSHQSSCRQTSWHPTSLVPWPITSDSRPYLKSLKWAGCSYTSVWEENDGMPWNHTQSSTDNLSPTTQWIHNQANEQGAPFEVDVLDEVTVAWRRLETQTTNPPTLTKLSQKPTQPTMIEFRSKRPQKHPNKKHQRWRWTRWQQHKKIYQMNM